MTGSSGRPRIFAFAIDNLLVTVAALFVVAVAKPDSPYLADDASERNQRRLGDVTAGTSVVSAR